MESKVFYIVSITCAIVLTIALALMIASCTYSITCVHTQGSASDVVDEAQSAKPDLDANLSLTK